MADTRSSITNSFLSAFIITVTIWYTIQSSVENGFTVDYSNRFLATVPKNLPAQTMMLNLSQNTISELQLSDFRNLFKLQLLILSHNLIQELDFSIFQYNEDLEYLDLSHNNLSTLSCHLVASLQYLDLSYNNYTAMPICPEFGKMSKLEHLSLSARRIEKSDFSVLAHLQLDFLFLDLEDLSEYGKLPVFNTKSLWIALPKNREFSILLDLELSVIEHLELSNIQDKQVHDLKTFLSNLKKSGRLLNLTLNNAQCTWEDFTDILQNVWESTIEYFEVSNMGSLEAPNTIPFNYTETSLKALTIKQTTITTFRSDPKHMYTLFSEMNITALTISDAGLIHMLCPLKPTHFTYICFSNNSITDSIFKDCNNLTHLETLILQKNKLQLLTRVSWMTSLMKSLKVMDVSQNSLRYENSEKCHWGKNLINLNLSANRLSDSVFRCLPVNIQVLDLQKNQISSIPKDIIELSHLEELNLASNKLTDLPGCGQFRGLRLLNVERNSGFFQSSEFSQSCQNIKRLKAGHNPFTCSCELRQLINLEKQGFVKFVGWPESYVCSSPGVLEGTLLTDFHISEFVCSTTLQVVVFLMIALVLAAAVSFLCFRYDVPWYLKMIWQWTRVKHRVWKKKPEGMIDNVQFHVFISYSERDSDWVKNVLIPNLEKEDGSVRICQHERNFIAGCLMKMQMV
ncbi:toll-like receptor 1 isoform X2 [Hemicordylus capensis]|uniref:toll-like receptor 1 isoform X2 n=1 Tax=Hemicordylus capensis TaxID=884348 RepID=UPI002303C484|nr:toll-like receptor 1 isoform X2 [Hemicordylus capensis]